MRLENGTFCPLLKKECIGLTCAWFTKVVGHDTNTGKEVDEYQCAIGWLPMLLIENSGQQRQTGAAVESFRNEMVRANQVSHHILMSTISTADQNVIEAPQTKRIARGKK
jgi:hypothetical protein